jgi:hypothetical protein
MVTPGHRGGSCFAWGLCPHGPHSRTSVRPVRPKDGSLYSLYTACCHANKYQAPSFEEFSRALLPTLQAFDIAAIKVREHGIVYTTGIDGEEGDPIRQPDPATIENREFSGGLKTVQRVGR